MSQWKKISWKGECMNCARLRPVVGPSPKPAAQELLNAASRSNPLGVYRHYRGGEYVLFALTVDEATCAAVLVHYYSIERGFRWTRTLANWLEHVDGKPRFMWLREATKKERLRPFGEATS